MTSKRTKELLKWDCEHLIHPATPIGGELLGVVFEEAYGIMLKDTEGKEYIDTASQLVSANLGYGRREIIDAAMEQCRKLQFAAIFTGWSSKPSIECGQKLAEITPPGLDHFLWVDGGSEATETAFQLARAYWQYRGKNKFKIIGLYNAYHGASLGSTSMSALPHGRSWEHKGPLVPGIVHIPNYDCYRCPFGLEYPSCGLLCARYLDKAIEREGADSVAAFIAEPIQGAGGCIAPPPEYWPTVRKICTERGVLLIADEVMSGFARAGKLFALEHWDVVPDIMTIAKGITACYFPFGAVAINDMVWERLKGYSPVGFTCSGNPVGAAAAIKAIDIYVQEEVAENANIVGQHLSERFNAEFLPLPHVGTLRGKGLFTSVEIVADKTTKALFDPKLKLLPKVRQKGIENGLFLRIGLDKNIWITPPCTITIEEMDMLLDRLYPIIAGIKQDGSIGAL